ncbi:MAG: permease [Bacteroidetes bacterium GWF2_42_66]|nr:MAG: permease [Bacteroidetes bacterium GWA2_42_15]OFX99473.1 MAG: permease [Bacteroidetes bacterium GWE2_42_39]OFY47004.1 MAG: permease [Bacteroidetes bacterium GWF2_42_66]HBL76841.1 EamA family transporter [Prolixibacteraceae bacterium]HCR88902.1 EamA family transporter [Prolixibacteraceae bacterium]
MWVILALVSSVLLGFYDVFKKLSLNKNAVLPVLLGSTITGAVLVAPLVAGSLFFPEFFKTIHLFVPEISLYEHALIFLKSVIVVSSWIFAFHAVKHLPLTIVAPIRATGPIWTLIGAIIIFREHLNLLQWTGVLVTLTSFYLLSTAGKLEGINFGKNIWVFCMIAATLLGAASGLYDKFIIRKIDRLAVQSWFTFYQVVVMLPAIALFRWKLPPDERPVFQWRWSIPAIAIFLLMADFAYFYALSYGDSMISIVSALRRGGVVITFVMGALLFSEGNLRRKGIYLAGILAGILIITLGS